MDSRRHFLGKVASGLAGTLAAVPTRVLGANDRIRVGFIGMGDRGGELLQHVRACPNTEVAAFCDVYTKRLEKAQSAVHAAAAYLDCRSMIEDKTIESVITDQTKNLHTEHF
jgi:predicted dehydrogenase